MHAQNLNRLILAKNKDSFSNAGLHHCLAKLTKLREIDVSDNAHVSGRCALLDITASIGDEDDTSFEHTHQNGRLEQGTSNLGELGGIHWG